MNAASAQDTAPSRIDNRGTLVKAPVLGFAKNVFGLRTANNPVGFDDGEGHRPPITIPILSPHILKALVAVLTILFLKYISDVRRKHVEEFRREFGGDELRIQRRLDRERFKISTVELKNAKTNEVEESFLADFYSLFERRTRDNVGELINIVLDAIEKANEGKLGGLFRAIDFNSESNLGQTKDRNRRLFLSPELRIDDIIKSKFGGDSVTTDRFRTHRALVKGAYDRFSEGENEFMSNVFQTNQQRPESPLLAYYLLWLLRQKLNSVRDDNVENRHWLAAELCQLFEGCGVAEELVMHTINRLYDRRLIEALDPNAQRINIGNRVAIKESGLAHIELILTSPVYVEQMAFVTGVNELFSKDEMRKNMLKGFFNDVRETFVRYVLKIDAGRVTIPKNQIYSQLEKARAQIASMVAPRRRAPRALAK